LQSITQRRSKWELSQLGSYTYLLALSEAQSVWNCGTVLCKLLTPNALHSSAQLRLATDYLKLKPPVVLLHINSCILEMLTYLAINDVKCSISRAVLKANATILFHCYKTCICNICEESQYT
jgi:hypothetical protein